ncbi:hypothetical protein C8J56DRAFT_451051 [Mycena floridula]|nr:hypothetical protein C8J56DRAFT_451051 [Mycena floridula]
MTKLFDLIRFVELEPVLMLGRIHLQAVRPLLFHRRQSTTPEYHGPLAATFRKLKIFSLSSFGLSVAVAPLMLIIESNLPMSARVTVAGLALGTSGLSTGIISWLSKSYVSTMRRISPPEGGPESIELTTQSLFLTPRITTVYDPAFLVPTQRAFAKWQLADRIVLPNSDKRPNAGHEETVAETADKNGTVLGRWIVKWDQKGEGHCQMSGKVVKHFSVHEELL